MEVFHEFSFDAAHQLPEVPPGHPCGRLHGHRYQLSVHVEGPLDERVGWVLDYAEIAAAFEPLHRQLDHHFLNEIDGLENPTTEHILRWLWTRLKPGLPGLSQLVLQESANTGATYRGE